MALQFVLHPKRSATLNAVLEIQSGTHYHGRIERLVSGDVGLHLSEPRINMSSSFVKRLQGSGSMLDMIYNELSVRKVHWGIGTGEG